MRLKWCIAVFLALGIAVFAAEWRGGYDNDWSKSQNWLNGILPDASSIAKIVTDNTTLPWPFTPSPVIYQTVYASQVAVGDYSPPDEEPDWNHSLTIANGGHLVANGNDNWVIVPYWYRTSQIIVQEGGKLSAFNLFVGFNDGTNGTLIIDGGEVFVSHRILIADDSAGNGGTKSGRVELKKGVLESEYFTFGTNAVMNIEQGVWYQRHNFVSDIQTLVSAGKITAYNGLGTVSVQWDPDTQTTIVRATANPFLLDNIQILNSSNAQGGYPITNMFDANPSNETLFQTTGAPAGTVYFVELKTQEPAKLDSIFFHLQHDDEPDYYRAVSRVRVLAKPIGGAQFSRALVDRTMTVPYSQTQFTVSIDLPVLAQEYRLEFVSNDIYGPRVFTVSASGVYERSAQPTPDQELWVLSRDTSHSLASGSSGGSGQSRRYMLEPEDGKYSFYFADKAQGQPYGFLISKPYFYELTRLTMKMTCDADQTRRAKKVTVKAKSPGSSSYDVMVYEQDDIVYTNNVAVIDYTLPTPLLAREYSVEWISYDGTSPRIDEINGYGRIPNATVSGQGEELWTANNILLKGYTPTTRQYPDNSFEAGSNALPTRFFDNIRTDLNRMLSTGVYYVDWKTKDRVQINALGISLAANASDNLRKASRITIKTKSKGSSVFDVVLYDNASIAYDANTNLFTASVSLSIPIRAQEFRLELTDDGTNTSPRIAELNAYGIRLQPSLTDFDNDYFVNLDDFAIFAKDWMEDTSSVGSVGIDGFEGYSTLPTVPWALEYGDLYSSVLLLNNPSLAHSGNKAMRWIYDVAAGIGTTQIAGVERALDPAIKLGDIDQIKLWLNRAADNGEATGLVLQLLDSGNSVRWTSPQVSVQTPAGWDQWILTGIADSVDPIVAQSTLISKIRLRIIKGDDIYGGYGTIDVDDIEYVPVCQSPLADVSGDCKVDIDDLMLLVNDWLNGTL